MNDDEKDSDFDRDEEIKKLRAAIVDERAIRVQLDHELEQVRAVLAATRLTLEHERARRSLQGRAIDLLSVDRMRCTCGLGSGAKHHPLCVFVATRIA